jgi:peroxiredoxin
VDANRRCAVIKKKNVIWVLGLTAFLFMGATAYGETYGGSEAFKGNIFNPGVLKPTDSVLKVKVGDRAPDFTLPSVSGQQVSLSQYAGKNNVVLSFVPAAWTPVCSDQWPGYNIVKDIFDTYDAVLLGITVDNIPTLFAWTNQMVPEGGRLWFPVLSDFWPHGAVADAYGVLRSDGVAERAIFVIDKGGMIRYIDVHDINKRPPLEGIVKELQKIEESHHTE